MKRYNFDRINYRGDKCSEGIYVHANSFSQACKKAKKLEPGEIMFRDNKPCPKNVKCGYCNSKEK